MKRVIGILLVVAAAVIVVVIIKYRQSTQLLPKPDRFIDLTLSGTGADCRLDRLPTREVVERQQPVIWRVTNNCERDATVEIFDFRRDSKSGTPSDPLEDTDEAQHPGRRRDVPPGAQRPIPTRVTSGAAYGVYSYRIKVNGTDFDPEVEVAGQD